MGTYLLLVKEFLSDYSKICFYTQMISLLMRHDNVVIFTLIPDSVMTWEYDAIIILLVHNSVEFKPLIMYIYAS